MSCEAFKHLWQSVVVDRSQVSHALADQLSYHVTGYLPGSNRSQGVDDVGYGSLRHAVELWLFRTLCRRHDEVAPYCSAGLHGHAVRRRAPACEL